MTKNDLAHFEHELDNLLKSYRRHRNPADTAVAKEVIDTMLELMKNYTWLCEVSSSTQFGGKTNAAKD